MQNMHNGVRISDLQCKLDFLSSGLPYFTIYVTDLVIVTGNNTVFSRFYYNFFSQFFTQSRKLRKIWL